MDLVREYMIDQRTDGRLPRLIGIVLILLAVVLVSGAVAYYLISSPSSTAPTVQSTQPAKTATALSPTDLYTTVTGKAPFINDPLDGKQSANWGTYTRNQNGYAFRENALHGFMAAVDPLENTNAPLTALVECPFRNATFGNFALQVHVAILQDDQTFEGMFFRADQQMKRMYRFYVDFYGNYNFTTEQGGEPVGTNSSVFMPDLQAQKSFMLTVIAQDTSFYLYINRKYVDKVIDTSYSVGEFGFFVTRGDGAATDVAFSQAEVWKL